jgi:hypothetical protein
MGDMDAPTLAGWPATWNRDALASLARGLTGTEIGGLAHVLEEGGRVRIE